MDNYEGTNKKFANQLNESQEFGTKPKSGEITEVDPAEIIETPTNRHQPYDFDQRPSPSQDARPTFQKPDIENVAEIRDSITDEKPDESGQHQDVNGGNDENYVNYYEKSEHEYDEGENQQDSYEDEYCDDQRG